MPSLNAFYQQILEQIDNLPDTTKIPIPVVALYDGTSRRSVKRNYPTVPISDSREGVELGEVRRRRKALRQAARNKTPDEEQQRARAKTGRYSQAVT